MLVKEETLKKMFEKRTSKSPVYYQGNCRKCGGLVTLEIHHLSVGFGMLGGALFEPGSNQLAAECEACYKEKSKRNITIRPNDGKAVLDNNGKVK